MEEVVHCAVHPKRTVEYVCPACKSLPLCKTCKLEHEAETGHATEDCKEIGRAIMNQHARCAGGRLAKVLAKGLRKGFKELDDGLLLEIDRLQESCIQTGELRKMRKLDIEGRYAELYFYAKALPAGGAKNGAAMGELNKRLLETIDKASDGLKKMLSRFAAATQCKLAFAAYKKDEVFVIKDKSYKEEEQIVSALKNADMSKFKAVYIRPWIGAGDCVASELASCLQTHPVSALYFLGINVSDAGAEVLAQAAFRGKSLSAFCIVNSKISDTGAKAVAAAVRNCRSLTTFYLAGTEISDSGATAVAEAVKGCLLSAFYLGGRHITYSGATAVAEAVKDCPLSAFCLVSREILDAGAIAVAKTMKDCSLFVFCLGGGNISDSGATAVAETLSSGGCASTLSALCLASGSVSDSGARKVADAVRGCTRLSEFYLEGKPISGETLAYILEGMAGISTIRSVNLRVGEISKEQMESYLSRVQQSGVAKQLKLRFQCDTEAAKSVCKKFATEWNATLAEFKIVSSIFSLFLDDVIVGVPK